jgi:hypothetical protein
MSKAWLNDPSKQPEPRFGAEGTVLSVKCIDRNTLQKALDGEPPWITKKFAKRATLNSDPESQSNVST